MEYKKFGWRDIHASLLDPSEDTDDFIKYIKRAEKWRDRIHIQSNWNHLYTTQI